MRWTVPILALALGAAAEDDAYTHQYKVYYKQNIKGKWGREELSEQRVIMVRGLEKHDVALAARWLMLDVVPSERAGDVVREAVRVLGRFKNHRTVAEMAGIYEKKYRKAWEARALTLAAFARIKIDGAAKPIQLGLKDKDPRVAAAACRAAGTSRRLEFKPTLVAHLQRHKHSAVRGAAALALAELRAGEAMPQVFEAFCTDKSHRVRYDAWLALKRLSLKKFDCAPDAWQEWWKEQSDSVPEGEPNAWGTSPPRPLKDALKKAWFFKIPVLADRIVFVLDVSLDMHNSWKIDHAAQRKLERADRIPNFFSVKTRWDLVRSYVNECLKNLPDKLEVAFVFFNHEVAVFPEGRLVKLSKKSRATIATTLESVKRSGSTAMYEGLKAGWGFVKEGNPKANFDKGCDTIIFVTDGQVKDGELKNKPDRLRDEVWRVASARNLRVHTVGLHNHAFALCAAMAKDSGGLYVHAQEHGDAAEPQDLEFWPEKKKAFEAARKKKR